MQMPQIFCLSLNHHAAPVELRELISNPRTAWHDLLDAALPNAEWFILSTCNRFELYVTDPAEPGTTWPRLCNVFETGTGRHHAQIMPHLRRYKDMAAAEHLCQVASSLDSLVLGESQILGQITQASMAAIAAKTIGPTLTALLRTAIHTGKRVRTETAIGANTISVSSIAIQLAEALLGDLHARNILVIGLGEMGQLTLKALHDRRIATVSLINRSYEPALALAAATCAQWQVYHMEQLAEALAQADVVFTATGSAEPIITQATVDGLSAIGQPSDPAAAAFGDPPTCRTTKLVLFDLAVPRDVAAEVGHLPNVHLIDIDHLETQVDHTLTVRKQAIPHVLTIIVQELSALQRELHELKMRSLVVDLRCKAESIRCQELERSLRHVRHLDPEQLLSIQQMSCALINKLLHEPTMHIKEMAHEENTEDFVTMIRSLFGLPIDHLEASDYTHPESWLAASAIE